MGQRHGFLTVYKRVLGQNRIDAGPFYAIILHAARCVLLVYGQIITFPEETRLCTPKSKTF